MDRLEILEAKIEKQSRDIAIIKELVQKLSNQFVPNNAYTSGPDELNLLKSLLESDQWPVAVENSLICNQNS